MDVDADELDVGGDPDVESGVDEAQAIDVDVNADIDEYVDALDLIPVVLKAGGDHDKEHVALDDDAERIIDHVKCLVD